MKEKKSKADQERKLVDRRSFIKKASIGTAALGTAAFAGSSLLTGCAPKTAPIEDTLATPAGKIGEELVPGIPKPNFMIAPAPIKDAQINSTEECDVLVIGAGCAGIPACIASQRAGAKTIVIQKGARQLAQGWTMGAYNTKQHKAAGIKLDINEFINNQMLTSGNWPSHNLCKLYAENSAEAVEFLDEILVSRGHKPANYIAPLSIEYKRCFVGNTIHMWPIGFMSAVMDVVVDVAKEEGVQFFFDNPAVQLIKNAEGRIIGAITKTPYGEYNKFIAKKGVILATGGFTGSKEMLYYYGKQAYDIPCVRMPNESYTGDGIKIAMWAGGEFQLGPVAVGGHFDPIESAGKPFLFVNAEGNRFMNEDNPIERLANQTFLQTDKIYYQVFDNKYEEDQKKFYGVFAQPMIEPAEKAGILYKGNSVEELAQKMNVPADTLAATVKRYNQMVRKGKDLDYGKNPDFLTSIKNAPYYAIKRAPTLLETSGGLDVTDDLHVKDGKGKPIPGMVAIGSVQGNFYGADYPMIMNASSNGKAVTFGMLAGRWAAKGIS